MSDRRQLMLQPLVQAGKLEPGAQKLSCSVGGVEYFADLLPNGEILFEGKTFRSPSAFSVYVKRKVNPSRKADDGWTSVKYGVNLLSHYRGMLSELTGATSHSTQQGTRGLPPRKRRRPTPLSDDAESETSAESGGAEPVESYSTGFEVYDPANYELGMGEVSHGRATSGKRARSASAQQQEFTFVQCCRCKQWRRVPAQEAHPEGWDCRANPDLRHADCSVPQEAPDEVIDSLLQDQAQSMHLSSCTRPPLDACTEEEFEEDLYAFLGRRGEEQLALKLRNKQITCNNHPIDIFGLYREVVRHGGFVSNERYDDTKRWKGSINFAGEVFPRMRNWTAGNRATSVGNQLHCNYRKFLLAYECAHAPRDLGRAQPLLRQPSGKSDPLAFLADVASADEAAELGESYSKAAKSTRRPKPRHLAEDFEFDFNYTGGEARKPARQRRPPDQAEDTETAAALPEQVEASLREAEALPSRVAPGSLLLCADSQGSRNWGVCLMAADDLPVGVMGGGCCSPCPSGGGNFPHALADLGCQPEDAVPVHVLASKAIGWVAGGDCQESTEPDAWAALDAEASQMPVSEGDQGTRAGLAAYRSLRQAVQAGSVPDQAELRHKAQAAGCAEVAEALCDLEGRLPPSGCLLYSNASFWEEWREATQAATTPARLAQQAMVLAQQLQPEALRRGSHRGLLAEVCGVLEAPPGGSEGSTGSVAPPGGPSTFQVSSAVAAMFARVDWPRLRRSSGGSRQAPAAGKGRVKSEGPDKAGLGGLAATSEARVNSNLSVHSTQPGRIGSAPRGPSRLRAVTPHAQPNGSNDVHLPPQEAGAEAGPGPSFLPSNRQKSFEFGAHEDGDGSGNAAADGGGQGDVVETPRAFSASAAPMGPRRGPPRASPLQNAPATSSDDRPQEDRGNEAISTGSANTQGSHPSQGANQPNQTPSSAPAQPQQQQLHTGRPQKLVVRLPSPGLTGRQT